MPFPLKKNILIVITSLTCLFTACAPSKEDYRNDYVKGCVNSYASDSTVANEQGRIWVEEYCNCAGDKLNEKMTAEQWRMLNKGTNEDLKRYQPFLQPCLDAFNLKREARH
jgi:hypothetical protein